MYLGKVIGTVVATTKDESLSGCKLLVVARLTERLISDGTTEIVVDSVGAGNGETVIVASGSSARRIMDKGDSVIDAAAVGIVDTVEVTPLEDA